MPEQEFDRVLKNIGRHIKDGLKELPGAVKVIGIEFIHDNFAKQGFETAPGVYQAWKKRKETDKKGKKNRRKGRSVLVDHGFLRRSWAGDTKTSASQVNFQSHLPYAEVHNDGGKAGRGSGFQMPERKMIGDSKALEKRVIDEANRMIESKLNAR